MKTLKTLLFIMICTASYTGCSENQGISDNNEKENILLTGTKWKLAALVDEQTHESIEPEPKDCNTCYTLEFDSDTTAIGQSVLNEIRFAVTPSNIKTIGHTKIGDSHYGNVDLFYEALLTLGAYEYSKEELKIYYDGKTKYLLFTIYPLEIEPVLIGKGELSGSEGFTKQNRVITSVEEWNALKTAMRDRINTLTETDIDFSAYQVIAIFDEIHPSGGWSIDITGITEYADSIVVNISNLKTGNIASVLTQPFHIVRIPVSAKAIIFKYQSSSEEPATGCKLEPLTPVTPSNEQKNRLDNVFSDNNRLLERIKNDTLFVINNQEDMIKFQGFSEYPDLWMEFDWDNQSIIGGKISTPSVSDEILSRQLMECLNTSSYLYEIEVKKCTSCWTAIGYHYFWAIYDRKLNTENISLTIKTVE